MPTGLIPVVIIAVGFVVQFFVQRNVLTRYDYQCGSCGATFSPAALSLALAPHRPVGRKYMRCPPVRQVVVGHARAEGLAGGRNCFPQCPHERGEYPLRLDKPALRAQPSDL
jgi:hypothetical protein